MTLSIRIFSRMTLNMKDLYVTLSILTFSIITFSQKGLFATLSINDAQHNSTLY